MVTSSEERPGCDIQSKTVPDIAQIWSWLEEVVDPEIPAISVVDLGIVRGVRWIEDEGEPKLVVTVTPTYCGCPATEVIASDIRAALRGRGIRKLQLETQLSPAWTTDWLTAKGRERLQAYGIAPPAERLIQVDSSAPSAAEFAPIPPIPSTKTEEVSCPRCGSGATSLVSRYGSTPCKALYKCRQCEEPFDAFKRH